MARQAPPVVIELKSGATPIGVPLEHPLIASKKNTGTNDYRPVQDLREVNKRIQDVHPTVPNPYNLLSTLPPTRTWYTVLDLKDAFFCLRLHPNSQPLFAFEWRDPESGRTGQLTWTRLPQGFKNSPTLFDEALYRDLAPFRANNPQVTLIIYIDDILLATETREDCELGTQKILAELERVTFAPPAVLNPATLLPEADETPVHQCEEILAEEAGTRSDLTDQPWPGAETWFTDRSSFVKEGKRRAGAAVVDGRTVIWASSLPEGTSAQKAELIALIQALKLAEGKSVNIYTDSRYAFATAHVHGAIYRQRGLLTSAGRDIKNKKEILDLLEAIHLPRKVAIIHCPGHQKGTGPIEKGNQMADQMAKEAAQGPMTLIAKVGSCQNERALEKRVLTEEEGLEYLTSMHRLTHLGARKMIELSNKSPYHIPRLQKTAEDLVRNCRACALTNAGSSRHSGGKRLRGDRPGTYWEVDFTEVKPARYGNKYLLVFVDVFSGWVETFPTKKETANVVAKKILEDILPRFGVPKVIGSDNGPAFVAQVSQGLARQLGINWKLHCAYRPQSSGQVERMNRTIKETLTKLSIETGGIDWTALLSLTLFRVRNTPGPLGLTPFEILFGAPPPLFETLDSVTRPDDNNFIPSTHLLAHLKALETIRRDIWEQLKDTYTAGDPAVPHQFEIGDAVLVRRHRAGNLEPRWKGPYLVLLTTPTAIKVEGIPTWVHASHVKRAPPETSPDEWFLKKTNNPLKLRLCRKCNPESGQQPPCPDATNLGGD
ncbi:uncharacterized protein LOC143433999 [Arvicanthis niloticus]|uniref:uncharacterized protein LOC143308382 n=1 Tax=Arvicanthis niloticus TaxID=61156 RepID=UPI00402B3B7B